MPPPRRQPPSQAQPPAYPQHLRAAIDDAPGAAGVYIFHGDSLTLPLYIGKSIHLRARLLQHLRNAEEARMLQQTRRISFIRTAGEIGALLLEAQLIKQQQPLFNHQLRRNRQLCSLQLTQTHPEVVYARDLDFANAPALHGLFASRHAALQALRSLADQHRLCLGALGLERLAPGKACFRSAIRLCAGVCRGDESPQAHHERLLAGLQDLRVACWPYPGAIGLVEQDADLTQIHVVRNWCYLGSAPSIEAARPLRSLAAGFDADGYRILVRPVLTQSVPIVSWSD